MNHTEYMREYRKTPNGKKVTTFVNWKSIGLVDDYELIYSRYIDTTNCELCNVFLEGVGNNKKCMDHNHTTNEFRNIVCSGCNVGKSDRKKPNNNTSGYKNIRRHKTKNLWIYEKQFNGKKIKIMRKDKIQLLCIKFAGMILYRK
tara:strand:+ start:34 stop:468 length:435 start_codon:yes stop_codon:yes gene_type:complete